MKRALSVMGALVVFALADIASAGGLPVSVAYLTSYAASAPDDQILDFVKSIDIQLEKTNIYQVNFPGLGPFNVTVDLSKTIDSGFSGALYGQKISDDLLTAYFKDIAPDMKTVPSNVAFPRSPETGPPNGGPGPGSGYCTMSASNSPSGTREKVNFYAWYHPDSGTYRVLATAGSSYDWVAIEGSPGGAANAYNSYIRKCITPPKFNEWMVSKNIADAAKITFGRKFINGYLLANPANYFIPPAPFGIGPNYAYTKDTDVCTPSTCDPATDTGGGTTTPGTGTTSPACTKTDGTTSGNPYDCAPSDNDTKCSIIDLPCNFRKAFIPRDDFFNTEIPKIFTKQWNLPTQVVDEINVSVPVAGKEVKVGLDFSALKMNAVFQGIVKLMAAFAALFWLLNFFGIPNVFGNSRGNAEISESVYKARRMSHRKSKK